MDDLILNACFFDSSSPKAPHFHDCHQLIYVTQGSAHFTVQGRSYTASAGTLVLISRFEEHSIHSLTPDYHRYALDIRADLGHAMADEPLLSVLVNRPISFRHAVDLSGFCEAEGILQQILQERQTSSILHHKMQKLLLLQLLLLLCRAQPDLLSVQADINHPIHRIQSYLETNYARPVTLAELARQFHLSPSYLSHLFKRITGTSVMGYLADCRMAAAKRLLAQTDLPVGNIVELCGFSDNSNFSRSFRSATSLSPTDFRAQFRQI